MSNKPKTVDAYFKAQTGPMGDLVRSVRDRIVLHGPHLSVKLAWSMPCYIGQERVISLSCEEQWVRLQLWNGARLANQFDRIEGKGKALRHVKIRQADEIDATLDAIINAALTLDRDDPQKVR